MELLNSIVSQSFDVVMQGLAKLRESYKVASPFQPDCRNLRSIGALYKQCITEILVHLLSEQLHKIGAYQCHKHYATKDLKERNHSAILHVWRVWYNLGIAVSGSYNNDYPIRISLVSIPKINESDIQWFDYSVLKHLYQLGNFGNNHQLPKTDFRETIAKCLYNINKLIDDRSYPLVEGNHRQNFRLWIKGN